MTEPAAAVDVLIIGAGQAGLAMGHQLNGAGREFLIVDSAGEIGASWRRRWDSLRLFSPAAFSALPELPFPAEPSHLPSKDEVADYLAAYAAPFGARVQLDTVVRHLRREPAGGFEAHTDRGILTARLVVVATGPFQQPAVPPFAAELDPAVTQLHTADYRGPDQLPDGPVVVVGSGNSGVQIAHELAGTSRSIALAAGKKQPALPQRLLGRDLFAWLDQLGVMHVQSDSRLGRRMRGHDPLIGTNLRTLRAAGVAIHGRAVGVAGHHVHTAAGDRLDAQSVVWATGYRPDYSWLDIPEAIGADGWPVHAHGVSPTPGLYYLGLPYQRTGGSALIGWVHHDAAHIAGHLARHQPAPSS